MYLWRWVRCPTHWWRPCGGTGLRRVPWRRAGCRQRSASKSTGSGMRLQFKIEFIIRREEDGAQKIDMFTHFIWVGEETSFLRNVWYQLIIELPCWSMVGVFPFTELRSRSFVTMETPIRYLYILRDSLRQNVTCGLFNSHNLTCWDFC